MKSFILKVIAFFALVEITLRLIYSLIIGPDVLLFGTRFYSSAALSSEEVDFQENKADEGTHNVANHVNIQNGYSKYLPNQSRRDHDKQGNVFDVKINTQGFRGTDFSLVKGDNVYRIIAIGASPTFGYGDRDNETYPYYLEAVLNEKIVPDSIAKVEVYNMGIPHLSSANILALMEKEALKYQPDVILFYGGMTDTPIPNKPSNFELVSRRLILAKLFYLKWEDDQLHERREFLENYAERSTFFTSNLIRMNEVAQTNNIAFYYITQQSQSKSLTNSQLKEYTYKAERDLIRKRIRNQKVTSNELHFLIHSEIINAAVKVTDSAKINLIDGIQILDSMRNELTSWVHLTPKANHHLANEIANILCRNELSASCK